MNTNLIITTLVTILISHVPSSSTVDPDRPIKSVIDIICSQTVNFNECESIVTSQLDSSHADIDTITKVTTKRALTYAMETVSQIQDYLLPNTRDSRDKAVFSACKIAYNVVVSRLQSAYASMYERDYVAMKAQQKQALRYIEVCVKRTNFFRRTPIVAANYYARLMAMTASISGQILCSSYNRDPF
ncbi:PREDICTED: uncharacterized protein LOC104738145 [Camelina sativa]|uniref:Uncharacterized protein LOC104738145 n=1 Tax=Camelina sativa TaxID=90675 RepID=A0ABM0VIF6_CAMSA|nr:PREDICTED: uncharacterized protein LOC104738145 [Camelina sativa]